MIVIGKIELSKEVTLTETKNKVASNKSVSISAILIYLYYDVYWLVHAKQQCSTEPQKR